MTPYFLSISRPRTAAQARFVAHLSARLEAGGLLAQTVGPPQRHEALPPLDRVRRQMERCHALLAVAFRRIHIDRGTSRPGDSDERPLQDVWLTSPFVQIEVGMAYQLGLPILVLRETGVLADGALEPGVIGPSLASFDPGQGLDHQFQRPDWQAGFALWQSQFTLRHPLDLSPPPR